MRLRRHNLAAAVGAPIAALATSVRSRRRALASSELQATYDARCKDKCRSNCQAGGFNAVPQCWLAAKSESGNIERCPADRAPLFFVRDSFRGLLRLGMSEEMTYALQDQGCLEFRQRSMQRLDCFRSSP